MISDITQLGKQFQQSREEKGLTLKEVENATSIRSNFLQAIEDGSKGAFLSDVYLYGFIRQYASFLDLDQKDVERQLPEAYASSTERHNFEFGIGTLETRGSFNGGVKWFPNLLWAGLTAGIILVAWLFAKWVGVI